MISIERIIKEGAVMSSLLLLTGCSMDNTSTIETPHYTITQTDPNRFAIYGRDAFGAMEADRLLLKECNASPIQYVGERFGSALVQEPDCLQRLKITLGIEE